MPATPNLVGRRFRWRGTWLKVLRLLPERDARGNRLWECRCKCGNLAVVTTGRLQYGWTRSCGCLKRRRFGRPYTTGKAKKEYAAKSRVFVGGRWWRSLRAAHVYLEVARTTFKTWIESCPWLGGEGFETRPIVGAHGRTYTYFAEDGDHGLDAARLAMAKRALRPKVAGCQHINDVARQLRVDRRTVRRWLTEEDASPTKEPAKGTDGRPTSRTYIPDSVVAILKEKHRIDPVARGRISVRQAAKILRVTDSRVKQLIAKGALPSAELERVRVRAKGKGKGWRPYQRPGYTMLRSEVVALKRRRKDPAAADRPPVAQEYGGPIPHEQLFAAGGQLLPLVRVHGFTEEGAGELEQIVGGREPTDFPSADDEDLAILRALADAAPKRLSQRRIALLTQKPRIGLRTINERMPRLVEVGLAALPRGKKQGYTITPLGKALLAKVEIPSSSPKPAC